MVSLKYYALHFANIYSLQLVSSSWWQVHKYIRYIGFFRFLLYRNVDQLILAFFMERFLHGTLSHPPCYLKRALYRLKQYYESSKKFYDQVTLTAMSAMSRFTLTDFVNIYTLFGSSQPPLSLRTTTVASLTRETSAVTTTIFFEKDLT